MLLMIFFLLREPLKINAFATPCLKFSNMPTNAQAKKARGIFTPANIFYTQSCCLFDQRYKALKTIRTLLYKTDPEKTLDFLLKFHTYYQSECPSCKSYCGWYKKEPGVKNTL